MKLAELVNIVHFNENKKFNVSIAKQINRKQNRRSVESIKNVVMIVNGLSPVLYGYSTYANQMDYLDLHCIDLN